MTAAVVLCACSHASRLHERDEAAEHGRGACMKGSCGCSELRPADTSPRPVAPVSVVDPQPELTTPAEPPSRGPEYACPEPDCGETFTRAQALGAHRRYRHPKPPAAAKEGSASQRRGSSAPAVAESPGERLTPGPATTEEDPAARVGDAPSPAAGPSTALFGFHARIELTSGGWVELTVCDATYDEVRAFVDLIATLPTSTGGTA